MDELTKKDRVRKISESEFQKHESREILYRNFCKEARGVVNTRFSVHEIPHDRELGYTFPSPEHADIYVNPVHGLFKCVESNVLEKMKEQGVKATALETVQNISDHQILFMKGVLVHEMLHTVYTDPKAYTEIVKKNKVPDEHMQYYHMLLNIIEDETIEARGLQILAPSLKRPLMYTIYTIWKNTDEVKKDDPVLAQVENALVQFTDMGIVKGSVSEECQAILDQILPIVYDAIFQNPMDRARSAYQVYAILKEYLEKDPDAIRRSCKNGMGETRGNNPDANSETFDPEDYPELAKKIEDAKREIAERAKERKADQTESVTSDDDGTEAQKGASGGSSNDAEDKTEDEEKAESGAGKAEKPDNNDGDESDTSASSSDSAKDDENNDNESGSESSENSQGSGSSDEDKGSTSTSGNEDKGISSTSDNAEESGESLPDESKEKGTQNSSESYNGNSEHTNNDSSEGDNNDNESESDAGENSAPKDAEEHTFNDFEREAEEGVEDLKKALQVEEDEMSFHPNDTQSDDQGLAINSVSKFYGDVRQKNYRITGISPETYGVYEKIKEKYADSIHALSKQLRKLANDAEERTWAKNGSICVPRYTKIASTARVFQRYSMQDRQNSRVCLLIDVSGSMSGRKIEAARVASICIAEAMAKAGLPFKVITFTEEYNGSRDCPVVHRHYVNYKRSVQERAALALIKAEDNNFDGFSIRYAAKDILREKSAHNLLIVISDGQPACMHYRDDSNALSDTKAAIEEAKKKMKVIGVGIDADLNILKNFYKDTFVAMTDMSTLMNNLGKLIVKEVATW